MHIPRKRYLLILPLAALVTVAALLGWGQLQPKPRGYSPTAAAVPVTPEVAEAAPDILAAAPQPARPVRYTVDARDKVEWVFFDFETGVLASIFEATDWDLAFRRTKLRTNSGATNAAGPGGAMNLGEGTLEAAVVPGDVDFAVDALDEDDNLRNPSIPKWYRYNFIRHVILARPDVYLVRTGGEQDALVRFESYYCEDESPGCVTFSYRLVPAPRRAGGP